MAFVLAKKLNMTQLFTASGKVVPVTVLAAPKQSVQRVKTREVDGYEAVKVVSGKVSREFRTGAISDYKAGQPLQAGDFKPGEQVSVTGTSKGRGFAGVMKRHGFHGAPASHGHSRSRSAGSIGQMFPQHVRKGMKMAGRMGAGQVTEKKLVVVAVDPEKNLLFVKGSVPGPKQGWVKVASSGSEKQPIEVYVYGAQKEQKSAAPDRKQPRGEGPVGAASDPKQEINQEEQK